MNISITNKPITLVLSLLVVSSLAACSDTGTGNETIESELEVNVASDIPANPEGGSGGGPPAAPTNFTYYSLADGEVVAQSDSATTKWDLAFSGTTLLVNSGTSGPGQGGAVILDVPFEEITLAPSEGYNTDTESGLAIPTGDENGWYNYTSTDQTPNHAILPIESKSIVIKTGDGKYYAKVRILSYYKGNPEITSDIQFPPENDRYYTFEYAIQMNGTRDLK